MYEKCKLLGCYPSTGKMGMAFNDKVGKLDGIRWNDAYFISGKLVGSQGKG